MITTRTVIPFGVPGDVASLTHEVVGHSVLIKETAPDTSFDAGEGAPADEEQDPSEYTGREFELEFHSSKTLGTFISQLIHIHGKLKREEFLEQFGKNGLAIQVWTYRP